ncbi:hypothetical protein BH18CHL2_BH18CHL2_05190 [soil metagenome]
MAYIAGRRVALRAHDRERRRVRARRPGERAGGKMRLQGKSNRGSLLLVILLAAVVIVAVVAYLLFVAPR